MSYSAGHAMQAYSKIGKNTSVESASPHRLITLLLDGALEKIAIAKGHIQRREIAQKAAAISRAIAIIEGLKMSLDRSVNAPMVENLDELYNYMCRRLLQANLTSDSDMLSEVSHLLREIKEAWEAIEDQAGEAQAALSSAAD